MSAHSRFGGSIAKRYINCAGSVALCDTVPEPPDSIYSAEGTAAHELGARCLAKDDHPTLYLGEVINGFTVDQPMCDAVVTYLNKVSHELAQTRDAILYVEHGFTLPLPAAEPGEIHGTCDALVYHPSTQRLVVFDYKHGAGVIVDVVENEQLLFYAAGAVLSHPEWRVSDIEMVIVQPRTSDADETGGVKRWQCDALYLQVFIARLNEAVALAKTPDAPLKTGDHCRWCPAAAVCPAQQDAFLKTAQMGYSDVRDIQVAANLPDPRSLDLEQLGRLLNAFDILDGWSAQVREYADALHKGGMAIPGRKLVPTQARARWAEGAVDAAPAYLQLVYGVPLDESMPRKLATLTDTEKALKARLSGEALTAAKADIRSRFTTRESSGLTLVPISDTRQAAGSVESHYGAVNLEGLTS